MGRAASSVPWRWEMEALRYLLLAMGVGLVGGAGILVVYDLFLAEGWVRFFSRGKGEDQGGGTSILGQTGEAAGGGAADAGAGGRGGGGRGATATRRRGVRWGLAGRVAACGVGAILAGESFVVVPDGAAGVRVSELWGVRSGT